MAREPENDLKSIMKTRIGFRWKTGSDWLCRKVLLIELSIKESWSVRVNYLCIAFVTFSTNILCIEKVLKSYKIDVKFLTETSILRSLEPKKRVTHIHFFLCILSMLWPLSGPEVSEKAPGPISLQ